MPMQGLHNGITFIVTRRCPLECDHCVMESGGWYQDHLTGAEMQGWLQAAHQLGITRASYSGGDPVLVLKDLTEAVACAHDLGMVNSLFTSAFWATSVAKGIATLKRLSGVDVMGISTSPYHQNFVPLERVANAIIAAREIDACAVEVQVSSFRRDAAEVADRLRSLLPEDLRGVPIHPQSIFAAGRAQTTLEIPEEEYLPLAAVDKKCPAPALTVEPDGLLRGCCSSLLALKAKNPFILGDLRAEKMSNVLERAAQEPHYQTMRSLGMEPILQILKEDHLDRHVPERAVNACDLCFRLYSQPEVTAHLQQHFAG